MIYDGWLWIVKHCPERVKAFLRETFCIHDYDRNSYSFIVECRKCGKWKDK